MNRRDFGAMGLSGLAAAALGQTTFAQQRDEGGKKAGRRPSSAEPEKPPHHEAMKHMQECAEACAECQVECDVCTTYCAKMVADGHKDHLKTLKTCQDCADVCSSAAQIVARSGPFSHIICEACAEACAACAKACEAHPDDAHMKECAEECRECEKACREMLKHAGAHHESGRPAEGDRPSRQPARTNR